MFNDSDLETKFRELWADTITNFLPIELLEWVRKNVRPELQNGALATTFHMVQFEDEPVNRLLNRNPAEAIILFHDSLFDEPYKLQEHVVLHEIAHLHLKHHSICGKTQEEKEKEADELAREWIASGKQASDGKT
jgi:hypothetical protein